jgi:RNA polymerase sigma factor (sigma-70 family)
VLRTQSDTRLMELARAGSEAAFEVIVARYRRSLVRYCARVVGEADAEEAAQDALMKAHAALLRGDTVRRLAPWLHVIAYNTALSYLRARSSRPQTVHVDCECAATVDASAEYREELGEVLDAVRALPDRQRSAIVMRELEGRSYDEIAVRLGSSNGAVRQLLNRARSSVRERVGAFLPVGLLGRIALAGVSGGEVAGGGATLSGACMLGTKACVAALLPATVAIVASTSGVEHRPARVDRRTVATLASTPREGGTTSAAGARSVSHSAFTPGLRAVTASSGARAAAGQGMLVGTSRARSRSGQQANGSVPAAPSTSGNASAPAPASSQSGSPTQRAGQRETALPGP